jgi:hypothetical protein
MKYNWNTDVEHKWDAREQLTQRQNMKWKREMAGNENNMNKARWFEWRCTDHQWRRKERPKTNCWWHEIIHAIQRGMKWKVV